MLLQLSLLFLYWYVVWAVFNYVLIPRGVSLVKGSCRACAYFLLVSISPMLLVIATGHSTHSMLFGVLLLGLIGLATKRSYLGLNLVADVVFQQLMAFSLFVLLVAGLGMAKATTMFVIGSAVSHLPILGLNHVSNIGKILILVMVSALSLLVFVIFRYVADPYNVLLTSTIHLVFYLMLMKWDRNGRSGILV